MDLHIDFLTLLVGLACNLVALSVALPLIMGRQVSHAARCTQGYMVLQALAWPAMIASNWFGGELADRLLSTVAIACGSAAQFGDACFSCTRGCHTPPTSWPACRLAERRPCFAHIRGRERFVAWPLS